MSILIRNMNKPICCSECFAFTNDYPWDPDHSYFCKIKQVWLQDIRVEKTKPNWCPLEEVPEFCGDLIEREAALDACEFIGKRNDWEYLGRNNYAARAEEIEKIPAIIKAE